MSILNLKGVIIYENYISTYRLTEWTDIDVLSVDNEYRWIGSYGDRQVQGEATCVENI